MTLKEEEITRKEMAKILPSIQIGHIDKDVKQYLNNTIADIIEEDVSVIPAKDANETINETEKIDQETEKEFKADLTSTTRHQKFDIENQDSNGEAEQVVDKNSISKSWNIKLEDDIPSSAADDVNSFLNNLIQRVDGGSKN